MRLEDKEGYQLNFHTRLDQCQLDSQARPGLVLTEALMHSDVIISVLSLSGTKRGDWVLVTWHDGIC